MPSLSPMLIFEMFLGLACLAVIGIGVWFLFLIMYRSAYPPTPKTCPHCGKPLPQNLPGNPD